MENKDLHNEFYEEKEKDFFSKVKVGYTKARKMFGVKWRVS